MSSSSNALSASAPAGVSPKRWARLQAFLGALPPAAAARLFAALESAGAGEGLPAPAMLDVLRPKLLAEDAPFPERKTSARRIFFTPFEDFFVLRGDGKKRRARIDRALLHSIWRLIVEDAALRDARRAAAGLDAAIRAGETGAEGFAHALFSAAEGGFSILLRHAEDDAAFRADLESRLAGPGGNGEAALEDLAELALLLPAAAHLSAAQGAFPRPVRSLTEENLFTARRLYADAAKALPDAAPYVLLLIAARMDAPWRALRLSHHVAGAEDERLPFARADAALVAEALFEDLEGLARGLERDAEDGADTDEFAARIEHFAEFAGGLYAEAERRGDGAAGARIEASRDIAAAALATAAERALAAVRRAQPVRHAGGSSKLMALRPDIARPLEKGVERGAREGAAFLSKVEALGERLGRGDAAAGIAGDAALESRRYASDLIAEIRALEGEDRARAKKRMEGTLFVAGPLLPQEEIALLKERAAAAAVSA